MTRPEHLAGLVEGASPPARAELVRIALRMFNAEEHAAWLAIQNARRQREHYHRQKAKPNDAPQAPTVRDGHEPNDAPEGRTVRGKAKPNKRAKAPTVRETPPLPPEPPTRTPTPAPGDAPARGEAGAPAAEPEGEETASRYKDGSSKHRPADLDAVLARTRQLKLPDTDAEYCWNKWLGNGFKNNGKRMEDWKAVVRSHQLNGYLPSCRGQRTRAGENGSSKPQDQRRYTEEKF